MIESGVSRELESGGKRFSRELLFSFLSLWYLTF